MICNDQLTGIIPGGGYSLVKGCWGCVAGWGRIFTTGLTIIGYIFSRVARMGLHIFKITGKKILVSRDLKNRKIRGQK